MSAFKLVSCVAAMIAISSLSADEPLFDAPLCDGSDVMQETTPLFEEQDFLELAVAPVKLKNSFHEEFHDLPGASHDEETDFVPDFIDASVTLPPEEAGVLPVEARITDNIPPSLAQQLSAKVGEKVLANETKATGVASPVLAPRIESSKAAKAQIDLREVFAGAPLIYSVLFAISIATVALGFYTQLNMRTEKLMPRQVVATLQEKLRAGKSEEALNICKSDSSLLGRMLRAGLLNTTSNHAEIVASMQTEGKRATGNFWQKLGLLNDVAIVAPMIGLLGTVVGMFYAFYDINRSAESMNSLFDGLGVSVGTTVAGLLLAIFALVVHSMSKYRLVKQLAHVETTANHLVTALHQGKEEKTT